MTYVYVLNEDDAGNKYVLYPLPGDDGAGNPLAAGPRHRIPARDQNWQITSAGGREVFLVIASREPIGNVEESLAKLEPAEAGRAVAVARLDPNAAGQLRGVGGMVPVDPEGEAGRPGSASVVDQISSTLSGSKGVKLIRIELSNPGPG
ncbi:MAG: DUF4384 domain-containing protein [Acidobacteriota bacterium]